MPSNSTLLYYISLLSGWWNMIDLVGQLTTLRLVHCYTFLWWNDAETEWSTQKANERCKDHLGGQLTKFKSTKLECSRNVRSRHFQPLQIHKKTSIDIDSQKIEKNLRGSQRSNPPPCRLSKWSDSDGAVAPGKRLRIWIARFHRFQKKTWMNLR